MIQSDIPVLAHGQIVYLSHIKNQQYLHSDYIPIKHEHSFFKKKSIEQEKYIVGTKPVQQDVKNLWQVLRVIPQSHHKVNSTFESTTINYDDCIRLRHFTTSRYLTSDDQAESQISKQGEVSSLMDLLPGAQQIFMPQRIDNPYAQLKDSNFVYDNHVHGNSVIRLINLNDNRALHSHTSMYKQADATQLREVTMYEKRDENDYWEIQIADQQLLKSYNILQPDNQLTAQRLTATIYLFDKVILKSCLLGAALHSHTRKYNKGSKEHEVTCRQTQPRDENDWWEIKSSEDDISISNHRKIKLFHVSTKNYLSSCFKHENPSGKGLEVCCKQENNDDSEWQIIVINHDLESSLPIEHPFLIKHTSTNQYLGVFSNPSSPSDGQFEVGLMKEPCHATMWQVEQQDSQFC